MLSNLVGNTEVKLMFFHILFYHSIITNFFFKEHNTVGTIKLFYKINVMSSFYKISLMSAFWHFCRHSWFSRKNAQVMAIGKLINTFFNFITLIFQNYFQYFMNFCLMYFLPSSFMKLQPHGCTFL